MRITDKQFALIKRIAKTIPRPDSYDADDLVQDTVKYLIQIPHHPISGDQKSYFARCLYRMAAAYRQNMRQQKRSAKQISWDDVPVPPATRGSQESYVELRETERTIALLPANWRQAILLAAEGYNPAESTARMRVNRKTLDRWLSNARRVLRDPDLLGTKVTTDGRVVPLDWMGGKNATGVSHANAS